MSDRDCNKCVYSTRDGGCRKFGCEFKTVEDIKADAIKDFSRWLVKYKVIADGAMDELIRDFEGEKNNDNT